MLKYTEVQIKTNNEDVEEIRTAQRYKLEGLELFEQLFIEIVPNLAYKSSFEELLELAFLSKRLFKIIRNLITHQSELLKITLGDEQSIYNYFKKSIRNKSKEIYEYKLIQYRDIKYIRCRFNDKKDNGYYRMNWRSCVDIKVKNLKFKKLLNMYCPQIERVHIASDIKTSCCDPDRRTCAEDELYDFTEKGFFSFEGLWIQIAIGLPVSNSKEIAKTRKLFNQSEFEREAIGIGSLYPKIKKFPFSYQFVEYFQPKRVNLFFDPQAQFCYPQLHVFENILKFKYISTINFINQPTTSSFLIEALKSTTLKSLSINFVGKGIANDYDTTEFATEEALIKSLEGLSTNTTLKKLVLNYYAGEKPPNSLGIQKLVPKHYRGESKDPTQLLEFIKSTGNTTLSKLGLIKYQIVDSELLSPLKQIPTITCLYYQLPTVPSFYYKNTPIGFEFNRQSLLNGYLKHINENPNIISLEIKLPISYYKDISDDLFNFIKHNKSLLKLVITIVCCTFSFSINDFEYEVYEQLDEIGNENLKVFFKYHLPQRV